MAFCKYCGTKLEDGVPCTCEEAVKAAAAKAAKEAEEKAAAEKAEAEKAAEEPAPAKLPAVEVLDKAPVASPDDAYKKLMRRGLILICIVSVMFMFFIAALAAVFGGGYKSPLKKAVKGINRERSSLVITAFMPEEQIEDIADSLDGTDTEMRDVVDDLDLFIEDMKDVCEEDYFGDDLKVSVRVDDKKEASNRDFRRIRKHFDDLGAEAKKAYKLKVELTVKGDDEREEVRFNIYSVKLSGRKWVLYADDKTMGKLTGRFGKVYAEIKEDADEVVSDNKESLDALSGEVKAQDD